MFTIGCIRNLPLRTALWCGLLLAPLTGCTAFQSVGTNRWLNTAWVETKDEPVYHAMCMWDKHVQVTTDSVNQGKLLPGIVGRVYLLDEGKCVDASGGIKVTMLDMTPNAAGGPPKQLVEIEYDAGTLKRLKRKDHIGEGYTLFVPWEEFDPAVREVMLRVCYTPHKGSPRYLNPTRMTLASDDMPAPTVHQQSTPAMLPLPSQPAMLTPLPVRR